MLLAIDAGNTNVGFALFDGDDKIGEWRCATDPRRTADEYAVWFFELLRLAEIDRTAIDSAVLASVVPDATFNISRFCSQHCGTDPILVGDPSVDLDLVVATERPEEVGADRLVNTIAARESYDLPAVVLDFGTATTFDVINANGAYMGGIIAPGPNLSVEALHQAAAKLPQIDIKPPPAVIGKNTINAMQSGVFWGYVGLIEGLLRRTADELKTDNLTVIATGGLGSLFAEHIPAIQHHDPDLTLRGLKIIHDRNRAA
ncbi:MAG: type III pantothenate kinase [Alphaproteobacteria bacterium]|nr:type III pantothenate kinase [Alphaproteobacteria bacterium SS10]